MTGRTLILEFHGWRGFHAAGGPLGYALTVGFITATWMPVLLSDWLRSKLKELRGVASTRGFVEMACVDVDGLQRSKPTQMPNVPHHVRKTGLHQ